MGSFGQMIWNISSHSMMIWSLESRCWINRENHNIKQADKFSMRLAAAAAAKLLQLCLTVQPHRRQPSRLARPWDSPGKNTGVGFQFLLQCMKVKSESEVTQSCPTLSDPMDCSLSGSSIHGIFQARVLEWDAIVFSTMWLDQAIIHCAGNSLI